MSGRLAILGAAAALMFVIGIVLAVAQPGNLGASDDDTSAATTSTSSSETTDGDDEETATSGAGGFGDTTSSTTVPMGGAGPAGGGVGPGGSDGSSTTTISSGGSGAGIDGSGSIDDGALARTGGPEWLLTVGGVILVLGVTTRRLGRR